MADDIKIRLSLDAGTVAPAAQQATKAIEGIGKAGQISAGQTRAAMAQLPAQLQDLAIQIQGGQSPLTALAQQGSQVVGSFGGVANAARALGPVILGQLTNPLVLAGVAAAGLGLAYKQGADESAAYSRALILSGNAAGTTAGQLQQAAQRISASVGTQGAAAAALTQLAQASNIDPGGLEKFAQAAVRMELAAGVAVADTVAQFSQLGKAPLQSTLKLNESTNFLTVSLYNQIKALSDQGRMADAARVAQLAYASALEQRATQLEGTLGTLEKSWRAVIGTAKSAWDAMLDVGRAESPEEKLKKLKQELDDVDALRARMVGRAPGTLPTLETPTRTDETASLQQQIADTGEVVRLNQRAAAVAAQRAAAIKSIADWDAYIKGSLGDQLTLSEQIAEATRLASAARKAQTDSGEIAKINLGLDRQITKLIEQSGALDASRDKAKAWAGAFQDFARIAGQASDKTEGLTQGQSRLVDLLQDPAFAAWPENWRQITLQQAYAAISAEQLQSSHERLAKAVDDAHKAHGKLIDGLLRSATSIEEQVIKLGDEEAAAELAARGNLTLAQALQRVEIARLRERQAASLGDEGAVLAIQKEIDARERLGRVLDTRAFREADERLRKEQAAEWAKTWDQIGQTVTDSLMRAFDSGKSFGDTFLKSIQNTFKTAVIRLSVQPVLASGAAAFGLPASAAGAGVGAPGGLAGLAGSAGGIGSNISSLGAVGSLIPSLGGLAGIFGASAGLSATGLQGAGMALTGAGSELAAGNLGFGLSQGAGAIAPWALAAFAGGSIGRSISGGRGLFGTSGNSLVNAGMLAGSLFGPLGTAAGGVAGGLLNRAFGTGKRETTDFGITGQLGGAGGADLTGFEDWKKKGGWFSGGKSGTAFASLDTQVAGTLMDAVRATQAATKAYAESLGLGADSVATFSQSIRLSLQGLNEQQQQDAIAKSLAGFSDGLATSLGAGLDKVAARGESAFTTLARLAGSLGTVNTVLDTLNEGLLATSVAGADAASKLIDTFGGADVFTAATSQYLDDYYTASERSATTTRQLTNAFAKLNLSLPNSRDAFRAVVESQDLTTDSGRRTYATLIQLSKSFSTITEAAADAATGISQSIGNITDEIARLRGGSGNGLGQLSAATLQAQFGIATAQARAGDQAAITSLPGLSKAIEDATTATARSASDVALIRASLAASLDTTLQTLGGAGALATAARTATAGGGTTLTVQGNPTLIGAAAGSSTTTTAGPDALLRELQGLRSELASLRGEQQVQAAQIATNTGKTARILTNVTPDGDAIATRAAT